MNNAYAVIHGFGIYIKVFSQLYNHNISVTHIYYSLRHAVVIESQVKHANVLAVFLVITTSLTSITNCNHFT